MEHISSYFIDLEMIFWALIMTGIAVLWLTLPDDPR